MVSSKFKLLILVLLIMFKVNCYCDEKIDSMRGIWIDNKNPTQFFSMDKINDEKYYVLYVSYLGDHILDFSGVANVYDETRLYIKVSEDTFFYIYLDYIDDKVLVLWNSSLIYDEAVYMSRANYIYDEDIQRQLEEDREKRYLESLIKEVKEMQNNKDLYGE